MVVACAPTMVGPGVVGVVDVELHIKAAADLSFVCDAFVIVVRC
jgi:hypothetical protein